MSDKVRSEIEFIVADMADATDPQLQLTASLDALMRFRNAGRIDEWEYFRAEGCIYVAYVERSM